MKLLEHQGKELLAGAGIAVPEGRVVTTPEAARDVAREIGGRVALKAQVPSGKRGKSGGIGFADDPEQAYAAAERLLGGHLAGLEVSALLVERCADIDQELYVCVMNDAASKGPLLLFCRDGGVDIEETHARAPESVHRLAVDIVAGLDAQEVERWLAGTGLPAGLVPGVAHVVSALYAAYRDADADLVEINPLVVTRDRAILALDAKVSIDAGSVPRQPRFEATAGTEPLTDLERQGRELGLQYIELDGEVGVLANGAGLTMTTLDVVNHYGGRPANFLEIGGDAYTLATPALRLVLSNPRVRSVLVNFCGAFARTDVMTEGVIAAIKELRPEVPVFFTIHGTGEERAIQMVREELGIEPFDLMDDAVRAAITATNAATGAATEEVSAC